MKKLINHCYNKSVTVNSVFLVQKEKHMKNTKKTIAKLSPKPLASALTKKLLPAALVKKYETTYITSGFTKEEVTDILTTLGKKIKEVEERELLKKKYVGLPIIFVKKCPCAHNRCNMYNINGIDICSGHGEMYMKWFPGIDTVGVNAGVFWARHIKEGMHANHNVRSTAKVVLDKMSKVNKAKIVKLIPELKNI